MKRSILLTAAVVVLLAGCAKKKEEETQAAAPVEVSEVRRAAIQRVIQADGILRAIDQSAVMPKIAAPVAKFLVSRGDHVKQGQLVAVLESRDLAAAVSDAKAAYDQSASNYRNVSAATVPDEIVKAEGDANSARQQMEAAKKLLESREQIYKEGALARRQVDEAQVAYAQAKGQYDSANKHLQSLHAVSKHEEVQSAAKQMESFAAKREAAQAQISYAEVHAPIAGVVADRPLFAGEMATPGTPLLTIVNVSSVIARVNLPQEAASHVRVGQKAHIGATDGSVETEGRVTVVSPAIDPQGTTVEVWVQASNPGTQLRPGGTVHVQIFAEKVQDALVVPASALLPGEEGGTILLAVGADNVAHVKKVQAGIRTAELAQILSGAEAGMKVVVSGGVGIEDGGKVKVETAGEKKESGKPDEDQKGTGQGRRT